VGVEAEVNDGATDGDDGESCQEREALQAERREGVGRA